MSRTERRAVQIRWATREGRAGAAGTILGIGWWAAVLRRPEVGGTWGVACMGSGAGVWSPEATSYGSRAWITCG